MKFPVISESPYDSLGKFLLIHAGIKVNKHYKGPLVKKAEGGCRTEILLVLRD